MQQSDPLTRLFFAAPITIGLALFLTCQAARADPAADAFAKIVAACAVATKNPGPYDGPIRTDDAYMRYHDSAATLGSGVSEAASPAGEPRAFITLDRDSWIASGPSSKALAAISLAELKRQHFTSHDQYRFDYAWRNRRWKLVGVTQTVTFEGRQPVTEHKGSVVVEALYEQAEPCMDGQTVFSDATPG